MEMRRHALLNLTLGDKIIVKLPLTPENEFWISTFWMGHRMILVAVETRKIILPVARVES
jgi:hypothetical protein